MMEILNGFPLLPERVSVVLSYLTWLRQKDLAHPSVSWLTHWQLCLGMKGDSSQAELLTLSDNVVLLGLVMTRKKQLEVLSFLENIGVKKVYLASDNYQQLKKWLYNEKGSERKAKMSFPFPAVEALHSRPKALVVGFDEKDFPDEVKDLSQVCFIWRARTYSFNGKLVGIKEVFLNSQIGRTGIYEIKRTLVQAGISEFSISHRNNREEVADVLRQSYAGFVRKRQTPPMPKTKVVVIGADSSEPSRYQKSPDLLWWPIDNDKWHELPTDTCLFLVSSGLFRYDRLSLSELSARRGVELKTFDKENLDEFLRERAQLAQQPSAPVAKEVATVLSKMAPVKLKKRKERSMSATPTRSSVIRDNLEIAPDDLVNIVQSQFPEASRQTILTLRNQIRGKLKKKDGPSGSVYETPLSRPPSGNLVDLFRQLHETLNLVEVEFASMRSRLDHLAPLEEALSRMQAK